MKDEDEQIGKYDYSNLPSNTKSTDYVILDKDYVQNMSGKLTQILKGNTTNIDSQDIINIDFDDFDANT